MGQNKAEKKRRDNGDGALYFRESDSRWVGSFYLPDGSRKYVYGSIGGKKEETRQKLKEAMRKSEQGLLVASNKQKLLEYLEYWLNVKKIEIKPNTYVRYRSHFNTHIFPALGKIPLQKLSPAQVQKFITTMTEAECHPATIRLIYALLSQALSKAVEWGYVEMNPCKAVILPRLTPSERIYLNPVQAQTLLQAVKGHSMECMIILALSTGLRRGELLALKWGNIDWNAGTLKVERTLVRVAEAGFLEGEPKTRASKRTIILPQFALDALKEHRKKQLEIRLKAVAWEERDLVFSNCQGGYMHFTYIRRVFLKVLRKAGLPEMHFHDLRHSAATFLLSMKVPQKVVQEILGHTTGKMTEKYLHVLPSMQEEAGTAMDLFFTGLLQREAF